MASLSINPPSLNVSAAGGLSSHQLSNSGENRLAFKIRSSNNDHYRVTPVYGFVEPGKSTSIDIRRTAGPPKDDKLVIQFVEVAPDATEPEAPFKLGPPQGEVSLPISAK